MKLPAGKFTEYVQIQRRQEQRGATGALERTEPELLYERWANVIPQASVRFQQLNAIWETMKAAYTLNGPTEVETGHWLEHRGRRFEVVGIQTPGNVPPGEAMEVTVICEGRDA